MKNPIKQRYQCVTYNNLLSLFLSYPGFFSLSCRRFCSCPSYRAAVADTTSPPPK